MVSDSREVGRPRYPEQLLQSCIWVAAVLGVALLSVPSSAVHMASPSQGKMGSDPVVREPPF